MSETNHAGNIIINLASLPDFLRKPILKKRLLEFFAMSEQEKNELINNALEAGPAIPFPNFAKLFKTWLEILCGFSEEQRRSLFSKYIKEICDNPHKLIRFNLDGLLEIFNQIPKNERIVISKTLINLVNQLDQENKRKLFLIVPDNARKQIGF